MWTVSLRRVCLPKGLICVSMGSLGIRSTKALPARRVTRVQSRGVIICSTSHKRLPSWHPSKVHMCERAQNIKKSCSQSVHNGLVGDWAKVDCHDLAQKPRSFPLWSIWLGDHWCDRFVYKNINNKITTYNSTNSYRIGLY